MKNYSAIVCASVLTLVLGACGGGEVALDEPVTPETSESVDETAGDNANGATRQAPSGIFNRPDEVTSPVNAKVRSLPALTPSSSADARISSTSSGKADPFSGRIISVRPVPPEPQDVVASFPLAQQSGRSPSSELGREIAGASDRGSAAGSARRAVSGTPVAIRSTSGTGSNATAGSKAGASSSKASASSSKASASSSKAGASSGKASASSGKASVSSSKASASSSKASASSGKASASSSKAGASSSQTGSSGQTAPGAVGADSGNGSSGSSALPDLAAQPPIPDPALARAVEVSGVILVGSKYQAIVKAPDEPTSRYVTAGQRLSGGRVLVKRIENQGSEPVVILEEEGVEVVRSVGAPAEGSSGGATALLPQLSPAS